MPRSVSVFVPLMLLIACSGDDVSQQSNGASVAGAGTSGAGTGGQASPGTGGAPGAGAGGLPNGGADGGPRAGADGGPPPGNPISPVTLPAADQQAFDDLKAQADLASHMDKSALLSAYPTPFVSSLGYDPATSQFLDRIQASALSLDAAELAALGTNGFVISTQKEFPTFVNGLATIYSEHLPLYVSADAMLESIHSSYDAVLMQVEIGSLIPNLTALLTGMRQRLATSQDLAAKDADLYLAVALSLAQGSIAAPVAAADQAKVQQIVDLANAAGGIATVQLFGTSRDEDFSQFTVRGHYTDPPLSNYFRAMMWLGRVDLRLVETQSDGSQVFSRAQYLAMLLLNDLVGPDVARWKTIDDAIRIFVGESDYMVVPEVASLVSDLGGAAQARAASDDAVAAAIAKGGYGKQEIASHLMVNDGTVKTLPLNRSFMLFGQRYVVDSHVFSEVVYDRLASRMMPSPLDAAFAALGNNQALAYDSDIDTYSDLPGALGRMRVLIDAHDASFFQANFYNLWLSSLRALSPKAEIADPAAAGLPTIAATEAWGRRMLNAQLGSWAELRHDTLLYAKQSYTGIPGCQYPDVYVEPYPEFWRAIQTYANDGNRIVEIANAADPTLGSSVATYFDALKNASTILLDMAERERRGDPFTTDQMAFINDAVRIEHQSVVCTTIDVPNGWYAHLFVGDPQEVIKFHPTIADVHTQPADEGGTIVGKVLHVGTGYPRLMVTTINTCEGPKAYAGVVYAYHEEITTDFKRLTDQEWSTRFDPGAQRPADVTWMGPVLAN